MADGFRQAGRELDLQVKMRVDIQQTRHQPPAVGVDDHLRLLGWQFRTAGGDAPIEDGQIFACGRNTSAVKHQRIANQGIPACRLTHEGLLASDC